jgi:hypothetical protein
VFRSASDVVAIYATVRDAQGRLATGLSKDDFEVRENGTAREIAAFSNEIQPITLAMISIAAAVSRPSRGRSPPPRWASSSAPARRSSVARVALVGLCAADRRPGAITTGGGRVGCRSIGLADLAEHRSRILRHAAEPGRRAILVFSDGADGSAVQDPTGAARTIEWLHASRRSHGRVDAGSRSARGA